MGSFKYGRYHQVTPPSWVFASFPGPLLRHAALHHRAWKRPYRVCPCILVVFLAVPGSDAIVASGEGLPSPFDQVSRPLGESLLSGATRCKVIFPRRRCFSLAGMLVSWNLCYFAIPITVVHFLSLVTMRCRNYFLPSFQEAIRRLADPFQWLSQTIHVAPTSFPSESFPWRYAICGRSTSNAIASCCCIWPECASSAACNFFNFELFLRSAMVFIFYNEVAIFERLKPLLVHVICWSMIAVCFLQSVDVIPTHFLQENLCSNTSYEWRITGPS